MKKEELIEMVNSTITTNGDKAITGQALNLALNAIIEAMGTGGGGGAKMLSLGVNNDGQNLTDEEKAANAEIFTAIKAAVTEGTVPPDVKIQLQMDGILMFIRDFYCAYGQMDDGMEIVHLQFMSGIQIAIGLLSDGSLMINV